MLKLGITGGIGSGKTMVCSVFERLGVPVYNADARAKWIVNNDPALRELIIDKFGKEAFNGNIYNVKYIGNIVFGDAEKLALLNSIIHPCVFKDWEQFCERNKQHAIVIKEAAIMLETESKNTVDKILLVYAPEALRIKRVMERDNISEEVIRTKIRMQMPEEEKLKLANYVIYNDGEHSVIEQVKNIYRKLTLK